MNFRMFTLTVSCLATLGLAACSSDKPAPPPAPAPEPAPMAQPAPPPPPAIPPGLTAGQQRVAKLQAALNANGAQLQIDGKMGPATRAAVKAFQQQHNLKPTGRPDPATVKALGG